MYLAHYSFEDWKNALDACDPRTAVHVQDVYLETTESIMLECFIVLTFADSDRVINVARLKIRQTMRQHDTNAAIRRMRPDCEAALNIIGQKLNRVVRTGILATDRMLGDLRYILTEHDLWTWQHRPETDDYVLVPVEE